jgi:hypothetical protein
MHPVVIAVYLARTRSSIAKVASVVRPMSVIGALFGYAFWKDDEQAGSYRFVGRIRTENALVLIEKFSTSILGTLRGRYRMPSGIILYQTTSADTV